jgi:tetratricopeptide (TPR) repeat protein
MARKKVTGTRPLILWGIIAIIVVLVVVVVAGLLVIYPDYQAQQDAAQATVQAQAQLEQHYQVGIAFQSVEDWEAAEAEFKQVITFDASYKDVQTRLAEVKSKQREALATAQAKATRATATVQARAEATAAAATVEARMAKATSVAATVTAQAKATIQAEQREATATTRAQATATAKAEARATVQAAAAQETATAATATAVAELEELKVHYQTGVAFQEAEDWEKAVQEFEAVIQIDANYQDAQTRLTGVKARLQEVQATAEAKKTRATTAARTTATARAQTTATVRAEATQAAKAAGATATATAKQRVAIDTRTHHLGDGDSDKYEPVRSAEGKVYFTRFWLDVEPAYDYLLRMDTFEVQAANPVWINDNLVGSIPGKSSEVWDPGQKLLVPSTYLRHGENELKIGSLELDDDEFDDFMFKGLYLVPCDTMDSGGATLTQIVIDDKTRHIGDWTYSDWEVPDPESRSYTKFFELPSAPQEDGVLVLKTFGVDFANPVRVNGSNIGNLPGTGEDNWMPEIAILVLQSFLKVGVNQLEVVASQYDDNYDDFMLKDIVLKVALK